MRWIDVRYNPKTPGLCWKYANIDCVIGTRGRLYNSTGFFFLVWGAHYLPFFIMGRQLFLHHYLPAHLASCLVAGAIVEFVFNIEPQEIAHVSGTNPIVDGKKDSARQAIQRRSQPIRERIEGQSLLATWAASGVIVAALVWSFWFFSPLTYGKPGLEVEQVLARKWLNYDFHFAK